MKVYLNQHSNMNYAEMSMTNCYQTQKVTKITHETKATTMTIMNETDKINILI